MSDSQPNILLLLSDQHSFRHIGYREIEEAEPVHTPGLDRLASSSAVFNNAYCPSPLCTPSRISLLTGKEPTNTGAWTNSSILPPDLLTLPGTLADSGYETCLVGKMHLGGNRQFAGFDHRPYGDLTGHESHQGEPPNPEKGAPSNWKDLLTDVGVTGIPESLIQDQTVAQETVSFLREYRNQNRNQSWFLCASFGRPHWPRTAPKRHFDRYWPDNITNPKVVEDSATYNHPAALVLAEFTKSREIDEEELQRARAAYFASIDYLDEIINDLIHKLEREGFLDNTIIIYASDHGELAGEHGQWDKMTWNEASVKVPLMVQLPGHRNGNSDPAEIDTPVSLLDLYPTICNLVDADVPENLDGIDLSTSISVGSEPPSRPIFVDGLFMGDPLIGGERYQYRMIRKGSYKYVRFRDAPDLLYDIESDPFETKNLIDSSLDKVNKIFGRLRDEIDSSFSFNDVDSLIEEQKELKDKYKLGTSKGDPNQYHFPDGRIINSDSAIYNPHVICEHPEVIYDDYNGREDEQ